MNTFKNKNKSICQVHQKFQLIIKRNLIFKEQKKISFKYNLKHLNQELLSINIKIYIEINKIKIQAQL